MQVCGQGKIDDSASNEICTFLTTENEYNLYYGGKETSYPNQKELAGAQFAINSALLNVSNINEVYSANQIQQTPEVVMKIHKQMCHGHFVPLHSWENYERKD